MNPTLTDGSKLIVGIEEDIKRGDIIVFDINKRKGNLNTYYMEEGINIKGIPEEEDVDTLMESSEGQEYLYNKYEDGKYMVKRVIGVPGDTVNYDGKEYTVNGEVVESDTAYLGYRSGLISEGHRIMRESDVLSRVSSNDANLILNETWELEDSVIPKGKYLVMGDNRQNSNDSRFFGLVDGYSIEGKVLIEYGKGFGIFIE